MSSLLYVVRQEPPICAIINEMGIAAIAASGSIRQLLSLAVAAGASPGVAPWLCNSAASEFTKQTSEASNSGQAHECGSKSRMNWEGRKDCQSTRG